MRKPHANEHGGEEAAAAGWCDLPLRGVGWECIGRTQIDCDPWDRSRRFEGRFASCRFPKQIAAAAFAAPSRGRERAGLAVQTAASYRRKELAMFRRSIVLAVLVMSGASSADAQAPSSAPETGRVFCEQSVSYRLADPATVAEPYRRFLGVWSDAAWDANTCAALIVENVDPDGTVSVIYAFGPLGSGAHVPGGVLHGTGVIRDNELRFQNSDGTQFAFRRGIADLIGRMTTPKGQAYEAAFKKTF